MTRNLQDGAFKTIKGIANEGEIVEHATMAEFGLRHTYAPKMAGLPRYTSLKMDTHCVQWYHAYMHHFQEYLVE